MHPQTLPFYLVALWLGCVMLGHNETTQGFINFLKKLTFNVLWATAVSPLLRPQGSLGQYLKNERDWGFPSWLGG